jgi:hypothetical protein
MNILRPFVTFNFKHPEKLSRKNKVNLTRHFNALEEIREGEKFKIIDAPKGANFHKVQTDLNPAFRSIRKRVHSKKKDKTTFRNYPSDFKVLFVPFSEVETTAVFDRKHKKWILKEGGQLKETIELFKHNEDGSIKKGQDVDAFVQDPKTFVDNLIKDYPEGTQFQIFNPGEAWTDGSSKDKASIGEHVASRVNFYSNPQVGKNFEPLGYVWIYGLKAILPAKEAAPDEYSWGSKEGKKMRKGKAHGGRKKKGGHRN